MSGLWLSLQGTLKNKSAVRHREGGNSLGHRDCAENWFICAGLVTIMSECNYKWSQETGQRLNSGFYEISNVKSEHVKMPQIRHSWFNPQIGLICGSSKNVADFWTCNLDPEPHRQDYVGSMIMAWRGEAVAFVLWLPLTNVNFTHWEKRQNRKRAYLIGCAALTLWLHERNHVRRLDHARPRLASYSAESAGRAHRLNRLLCPLVATRVI